MPVVLVTFTLFVLIIAWSSFTGAPWVPARKRDFAGILEDLSIQPTDRVIELGCGDGRLLTIVAPHAKHVDGYEINPVLWLIAWARCFRQKNVHVHLGDFWRVNLSDYQVVITFLVPRTMPKLAKKAKSELRPDSRLLSYVFEIAGKKPAKKRFILAGIQILTPTANTTSALIRIVKTLSDLCGLPLQLE